MKNTFIILFCSIVLSMCFSCSESGIDDTGFGKLTGTVVSSGDNEPLENVKITTNPASTTVFTNAAGKFEIEKIAAGDYSVQAQLDDYQSAFEAASVINGETASVVFELQISTFNNKPPTAPELISPEDNGTVESSEVNFIWSASDPDGDDLTYSLELRNDQNIDVQTFESITDTTYTYSPLILGAKYFWQITADDGINAPVLSTVSSFKVIASPTGNRFLFVRNVSGNNVIFSSDEEGNEFQLTSQNTNSFRPRRNVTANKIAYLQTNGAKVDIYTMNLDGTEKTKVTSSVSPNGFNLNEINIAWPKNSDRIYFTNFDKLYSIRSNGQGLSDPLYKTTDGSFISEVAVSTNQNVIVLKTNDINGYNVSIFTINASGAITNTIRSGAAGAASGLDISIDNKLILYSYDDSEFQSSDYQRLNSNLKLFDLVSGTETDLSDNKEQGTNDLDPRFSPNEAQVIFTNTSIDGISQRNVLRVSISDVSNTRKTLFLNAFMPDWE